MENTVLEKNADGKRDLVRTVLFTKAELKQLMEKAAVGLPDDQRFVLSRPDMISFTTGSLKENLR